MDNSTIVSLYYISGLNQLFIRFHTLGRSGEAGFPTQKDHKTQVSQAYFIDFDCPCLYAYIFMHNGGRCTKIHLCNSPHHDSCSYNCTIAEAQVSPAPKAAIARVSPFLIWPFLIPSASAIGTEEDEVLPNF